MKRSQVVVQPALPGLDGAPAAARRSAHRSGHTRVWSDPAVVEARAQADAQHGEWRRSFVRFVARLPARRRAELRRRIGLPGRAAGRGATAA